MFSKEGKKENTKQSNHFLSKRHTLIGMLLILPALASLVMFKYFPMILGMFISFFKLDLVNMPGPFVGFDNYIRVFQDPDFYASMLNNLKVFIYTMLMNFGIPIILAILVDEVRRGKTLFRLAYFIPGCVPGIAMMIIWKFFWQPDYGLANYIVGLFGVERQMWLNDVNLVYFCLHFPSLVVCGGMNLIIYLSALQDVPQELYEAAMIDGAGVRQRLRHITLPNISGTVYVLFTLQLIGCINAMENILVMTGGGPANSTRTVLLHAYRQATDSMDYSYAITMITVVYVFTLILNIFMQRRKNKEA